MGNLVITRRTGQQVVIETDAGDIVVHVSRVHGSYVGLSIDAPRSMDIRRAELPSRRETSREE